MASHRRDFIKRFGLSAAGIFTIGVTPFLRAWGGTKSTTGAAVATTILTDSPASNFKLSLAQWSLHRRFFGDSLDKGLSFFGKTLMQDPDSLLIGASDPFDFPAISINEFGINCIELVNTFYYSKAKDSAYWERFKNQCDALGVTVNLIMCDALGNIGDTDDDARRKTVQRHHDWIDIAKQLGASAVRVNAAGQGTMEEVAANVVDGLSQLNAYGLSQGVRVLVENHGGYSSNGQWLAGVMKAVDSVNCGTLPAFGNFCIERSASGCINEYDRYLGMEELMPFAQGVSAKAYEFDSDGNEQFTDFMRAMTIVKAAGYEGYVGIEYEGSQLSEELGIRATRELLEKCFARV